MYPSSLTLATSINSSAGNHPNLATSYLNSAVTLPTATLLNFSGTVQSIDVPACTCNSDPHPIPPTIWLPPSAYDCDEKEDGSGHIPEHDRSSFFGDCVTFATSYGMTYLMFRWVQLEGEVANLTQRISAVALNNVALRKELRQRQVELQAVRAALSKRVTSICRDAWIEIWKKDGPVQDQTVIDAFVKHEVKAVQVTNTENPIRAEIPQGTMLYRLWFCPTPQGAAGRGEALNCLVTVPLSTENDDGIKAFNQSRPCPNSSAF
jgi:hypothetical protein